MRSKRPYRMWCAVVAAMVGGCATVHPGIGLSRPQALAGEWIDLSHTTAADTALWVLRGDGYDGSAHILTSHDHSDGVSRQRIERRYGSWYLRSSMSDSVGRAICFARRLGRDGATCIPFSLDSVRTPAGMRLRLIVHGYQGEHRTGDRELVERKPGAR